MFYLEKLDEIFRELPNIFGIVDNILGAGYDDDGINYDKTIHKVLQL